MKQKNPNPKPAKPIEPEYTWGDAPGGQPQIRWEHSARPLWAQVLPEHDAVLLLELSALAARRVSTGEVLWQQPSKEMPDDLAADGAGVLLAGGAVISELDPKTGAVRWRQRPGGPVTALAVDGSTAYAATRGPLFALNRADGKQLWRTPCAWEPELRPFEELNLLAVDDPETETVHALDSRTGAEVWQFSAEGQPVVVGPAVNGTLIVSAHAEGVAAIDVVTGQPRWRLQTEGAFEAAGVLLGDRLFLSDGSLHAVDPATGKQLWGRTLEDEDDRIFAVRPSGEMLLVETWKGRTLALAPDDGRLLWERRFGQAHGMAEDEETLYLRVNQPEREGGWSVLAVRRETGELVWELRARRLIPDLTRIGRTLLVELRTQVLALSLG